jgi:hypothetical protein
MKRTVFPGMRFGRLVVTGDAPNQVFPNGREERQVRCACDCGNEKVTLVANLRAGNVSSCGCFRRDHTREKSVKHDASRTPIYNIYRHMLNRCYNPKVERYPHYGGRGITVCDDWRGDGGFERWIAYIGERPSPHHSIDRIDTNGNYEPGNVQWSLPLQQSLTKRRTHVVTIDGLEMSLRQAAALKGVLYTTAYYRYRRGQDPFATVTTTPERAL